MYHKGHRMSKELSQKSKNRILTLGWIFIVLQVMAFAGMAIDKQERDPSIEAFLQKPTTMAIAGTLGHLIGINALPLVALLAGLTLWRHDKNKESKALIIAGVVVIIASSILVF